MATAVVEAKALRLLAESRVRIEMSSIGVVFDVRGNSGDYHGGWDGKKLWWCPCDCIHSECAHLTAVRIALRAFGVQIG